MSKRKTWKERLVLGKNEVFKAGNRFQMEVSEERTFINMESFSREYKLAQAYANVRNLEYRSDKPITIQTFKDYIRERGDLLKLLFKAEQKPRPNFSSDEVYRNTKTNLHYPNGDLLVLVDQTIYSS